MSIYYFIALLSTSLGIFILFIVIYGLTSTLMRTKIATITFIQMIILAIGIVLTVWGIDMLVHLDQF